MSLRYVAKDLIYMEPVFVQIMACLVSMASRQFSANGLAPAWHQANILF